MLWTSCCPTTICLEGHGFTWPGAVPSTLYQKLKFVIKGQLICIAVKENMIATTLSGKPYVEMDEKAVEFSFISLEFINAIYVGRDRRYLCHDFSEPLDQA